MSEVTLLDKADVPEPPAIRQPVDAGLVLMFERLAKDKDVDPEKLEKLIDLQERILKHDAESAFWEAFARMQAQLPTIEEDGSITVDGKVRSRYSTNEAIQETIRPVLSAFGFSMSHRNATSDKGLIKVTGILAHSGGHKETDTFESLPDSGGSMNSIQRIGSTRSYGARYTTIALLNIVSRAPQDRDDDGQRSQAPDPPNGYEAWAATLEGIADDGFKVFDQAWQHSKAEFKNYMVRHNRAAHTALKKKASAKK